MTPNRWQIFCAVGVLFWAGCATVEKPAATIDEPTRQDVRPASQDIPEQKLLKRKLAIGRFTNETRYGKALLGGDIDPLGRQTSDMLAARLIDSGKFIVLERHDVGLIEGEAAPHEFNLVGVDALIVGSLTEFGRNVTGKSGFLSGTKLQTAHAKVEVRLVDVRTGHAFHSASGTGEASLEAGEIAGFGSQASYDATLNDKAIGAAISDLMNDIVSRLEERPWHTDILKVEGNQVFLSGGKQQGLNVGDELLVKRAGEVIKSRQSGFNIQLPGEVIARIQISSQFGDNETNEGSIARLIDGSLENTLLDELYITDSEGG